MSNIDDKGSSSKIFGLAMIAIVVAGIAAVVVMAQNRESTEQTAEVAYQGETIEPNSRTESVDSQIGEIAPTISGTDFDGNEVVIEPDGRNKAIYFIAHWCPHCQAEVPIVQDLIEQDLKPNDLDIYSVSTLVNQSPQNFPPEVWLETENWTPPVIRDDSENTLFTQFGGSSIPYIVYLDGDNRITNRVSGQTSREDIQAAWDQAVSSNPDANSQSNNVELPSSKIEPESIDE